MAEDITDTVIAQEKFRTVFEVSMVRGGSESGETCGEEEVNARKTEDGGS